MINKKPTRKQLFYQKYVLIGAALGLYFGIFFRPVREPSFTYALILGIVATVATLAVNAIQKKRLPSVTKFFLTLAQYTLLIVAFEARHVAYDWGGRVAATILSTFTGIIFALTLANNKLRNSAEET